MAEITLPAVAQELDRVISFVEEQLGDCPVKEGMQIALAVEEIFINISRYAYAPGSGEVAVGVSVEKETQTAVITFSDAGAPYDPLQQPDPDVTLSAEERTIGGLGIYMVKKSMDTMEYRYCEGRNLLTIRKQLYPDSAGEKRDMDCGQHAKCRF